MSSKYIAGAFTLAINDINADPLQGRRFEYIYADSGCGPITGVAAMQELLHAAKPIHGVIGAGCSGACESTAFLTAERGLPQVPRCVAKWQTSDQLYCHMTWLHILVAPSHGHAP